MKIKHGYAIRNNLHPLYRCWIGIKVRCYNINCKGFEYYGARGIKMCDEWLNDPQLFVTWGLLHGWKRGLQIDRIDNNGNYTPNNCRFITKSINNSNRRRTTKCQKQSILPMGVWKNKNGGKFCVAIRSKGKKIYLGTFDTIEDASRTYQDAAFNIGKSSIMCGNFLQERDCRKSTTDSAQAEMTTNVVSTAEPIAL